ncbi:FtsH protease activity modulator HflK [Bermanella marisrubri]|uniref:Protein HflK n=1 Tax=Bermanella marisrubri TaxID=207949 RepID=Q1N275_9GAMM|nr:FtsH protease activity modulator HflK [Bermanella marisrubri]EAT12289.1 HflK protein [Bermanella marisrubri]QIZ85379.1 FtsH protease activity modulator HflK [Bermanella marisrubri]
MAWNEPGGGNNGKDPWGNNNRGGGNQPPDLDEALKQLMDKLNGMFGGGKKPDGGSGKSGSGNGGIFGLIILVLVGVLIYNSVYTIDEQQRGVVLTLGKYDRTLEPGLQFVIPFVESVQQVNVTSVRNSESKELMLTQDENVVEVAMNVQYRVADPVAFSLRIEDPVRTLEHAAESALRHEVGSTNMDPILTSGRAFLADSVLTRLQNYLENYSTGIYVDRVNIKEASAPSQLQAAFDDVINAKQDKERFTSEAEAYANTVIPEARGKAQRMLEEASAYRSRVVSRAEGEADRFVKLYNEYRKAPQVTRERLYLDAIGNVYKNASKVLVDVEGGNNMMYLPLDKIMERSRQSASEVESGSMNINDLTNRVVEELRARQNNSSRGGR